MKRPLVYILVFIIVVSSITVPLLFLNFPRIPVPPIARQVDPATAPTEIVYGPGLLIFYGAVIGLIDSGNLSGVKALLGQTGFLHIPSEISFAVNTFNSLLNSTANVLAATDREIRATNSSVSTGRVADAGLHLQAATTDLRDANRTITELVAAGPRLASLTGIPPPPFLQKVNTLVALYSDYASRVKVLQSQIVEDTKLVQTSLTFVVSPSVLETGSNVSASGTLITTSGMPLDSRDVTIFFSEGSLGRAVTDPAGRFVASFQTPFVYQQTVSLFASYLPAGNDTKVYAPSSSPPVQLRIIFSSPEAKVSVPGSVYAGLSLSVNGTLSANGSPLSGYTLTLGAFGLDHSTKTLKEGQFSFKAIAPGSLSGGSYQLTLQTAGNTTVGPLNKLLQVNVIKLDPSVAINVPAFVIAGFGTTIAGVAEDNGSLLQGASVLNISPSPSVNTTTNSGLFSFEVTPALTLPTGEWSYTIGIYPKETWISTQRVNVSLFVINPGTLVLPAFSAGLLLMIVRRRRSRKLVPSLATKGWETFQPVIPIPARTRSGLTKTYYSAMELVERATFLKLRPHQTLREYLNEVMDKLKGWDHFEYITLAVESALYGPPVTPENEIQAEKEFELLRRALET